MKYELTLQLENVFGGDGFVRYEDQKIPKLVRKKVKSRKSEDIGVSVDRSMEEIQYEIQKVEINTFKQENGNYYLRLGGIHGKLWGVLREIGYLLRETGKEFGSKAEVDRLLMKVIISPVWIKLKNIENMHVEQLQQILNAPGKPMIIQNFDVIGKCLANVSVEFPDMFQDKVEKLLESMQNLACLNKRRAIIKILEKKVVE
jgi:uncharacterized membrane protein